MDNVELGVKAGGVDGAPTLRISAFEKDLGFTVAAMFGDVRGGDRDGVVEKVADVGAEFEERFVRRVLGFFNVL